MDRNNNNEGRNEDKDLPGYPHYPSSEDITNPSNGLRKVDTDVENLANSSRLSSLAANEERTQPAEARTDEEDDDDLRIVPGTEADVTEEDLILLGDKDGDQDMNDDEMIKGNARVDFVEQEDDLDVPGSDEDDDIEELGEEDEENNYYSLGGDRHENLEDDPAGNNGDQ